MTIDVARALPVATVPVVRAYVRDLRRQARPERVLGIRAQPVWTAAPALDVDGAPVHVRPCISALAVREALVEQADHPDDYLVVLTDVGDDDLGHGIRARLANGYLQPVRLTETVKASFAAPRLDPLLAAERGWATAALVDHEPAEGWPPAPGGVLTLDFALGRLSAVLLGRDGDGRPYVDDEQVDVQGILRWSLDSAAVARWRLLDPALRAGLGSWLAGRTGAAGQWTLRTVEAGPGRDALAWGVVAGLLWHPDAPADPALTARGQLIARLGADPGGAALAWSRSLSAYLSDALAHDDAAAARVLDRAEALLGELNAASLVALSDQLPGAFRHRLRRFAATARGGVRSPAALPPVEQAYAAVAAHDLAGLEPRAAVATMALRLLRWLATQPDEALAEGRAMTLAEALDRQAREDAWVDRAYADVWNGDPEAEVGSAYAALARAVAARRALHDQQLARLLATVTEDDTDLGRIIPVEDALARIVRPIVAAGRRVLLVVVDGMSTAVLARVADGLRDRRWTELVERRAGGRQGLLAALPTITSVSRTSLLTGRLAGGDAAAEKAGFAAATGDPRATLFHKQDLRTPAGDLIAPDIRAAIEDPDVRVVGAVLNTVDDALDKMDPGGTSWSLDQLQHLAPLVTAAQLSDRVLVLTADHGHVVERGSAYRPHRDAGGARWRPASAPAGDGEIALRGRRVLLDDELVLPWREDIRYTAKKAGYHGGASAAEVAVPVAVFVSGPPSDLAGWVPGVPPEPPWWLSPLTPDQPAIRPPAPAAAPTLFDEDTPATADPGPAVVEALLASDVFAEQRRRAGRAAPDAARVGSIVAALLRHGGRLHETTLASTAQVPAARLRTTLAAVRRVLSVEGYEALRYDADGVTVVLDVDLLREQFRLDGS